jgi:hypothetical protein
MLWFLSPEHTNELVLLPEQGRLFASAGDAELVVLDVSDPDRPSLVDQWVGAVNGRAAWGLDVTETHVYLGHITTWGVPFIGLWSGVVVLRHDHR